MALQDKSLIILPSADGKYYSRYPNGNAPVGGGSPSLVLDTRFAGSPLPLTQIQPIPPALYNGPSGSGAAASISAEYRFEFTDSDTGQVFGLGEPEIYGAEQNTWHYQIVCDTGERGTIIAPLNLFNISQLTGITGPDGGSTALRVVRTAPYFLPDQAVMQLHPDTAHAQGMYYMRLKFRLDPTWPNSGFVSLLEAKTSSNKVEAYLYWEPGLSPPRWFLRVAATTEAGGDNGVWASATSDPPYWSKSNGSMFFEGAFDIEVQPTFGRWVTVEFAFRLENEVGTVAGGAANGWVWCATAEGTTSAAPANGSGTQRCYVQGPNIPGSATIKVNRLFPMLYYAKNSSSNKYFDYGRVEVWTDWPGDASPHPVGAT